jgi:hypothetical protein
MQHPYTGELVYCAECDGTQHDEKHIFAVTRWEECEGCGCSFEACVLCKLVIGCCCCGLYHAIECPWPV